MPPLIVATEYVEVSSVPLATPAWRVVNVSELWQGPEVRGDDRLVPLVDGVVPYPRRPDVTVRTLRVHIFGDYDHEGNAHTDGRAGLWANIAYLRDNVADPVTSGDGTRPIVVHLPDGDVTTGCLTANGIGAASSPDGLERLYLDLTSSVVTYSELNCDVTPPATRAPFLGIEV